MAAPDSIPPDLFLSGYPPEIRDVAERLRGVVHEAVPEAIERVRMRYTREAADLAVMRGREPV